jgi:CBS-domain-containing membrane protein
VRNLAFGPQEQFERSLSYTVAAFESQGYRPRDEGIYIIYNEPGCMVGRLALREFRLVAIPFATSIVLVLGSPETPPAQPRALVGGHMISTLVGLLVVKTCGPAAWAAALAVGLAMIAMHLTGTFHPPAGIDPLVVVTNNMSWSFLFAPVGIGALLLTLFAFAWHNLVARGANKSDIWPVRWW